MAMTTVLMDKLGKCAVVVSGVPGTACSGLLRYAIPLKTNRA